MRKSEKSIKKAKTKIKVKGINLFTYTRIELDKLQPKTVLQLTRLQADYNIEIQKVADLTTTRFHEPTYVKSIENLLVVETAKLLYQCGEVEPEDNCKKCHGRGYTSLIPKLDKGKHILDEDGEPVYQDFVLCKCVLKQSIQK